MDPGEPAERRACAFHDASVDSNHIEQRVRDDIETGLAFHQEFGDAEFTYKKIDPEGGFMVDVYDEQGNVVEQRRFQIKEV